MKRLVFFLVLVSVWSCCNTGTVRVASLDDKSWEVSQWISAADAPVIRGTVTSKNNCRAADGASWFVNRTTNIKKVERAVWMATGLGIFELYVNGVPVGEEILKPGFTHPEKTKLSFTYDISSAFNTAEGEENILAAQVTPGWWADKIVTPNGHDGMVGSKCAFRAVLNLEYSDGTSEQFGTDTSHWLAGIAGPVVHAAIFDGEIYDARILPGYLTPEKLSEPVINSEFAGEIVPSNGAEVYFRHDLLLKPVRTYLWKDIENSSEEEFGKVVVAKEFSSGEHLKLEQGETLVVDFGQNAAAVPSFRFRAEEGTTLTCLPAEILNDGNGSRLRGMDGPEGSVHRQNLRIPALGMSLEYTFGSNSWEEFCPRCTFFGYRYLSVTASGPVEISRLESVPVSSITDELETGSIVSGNDDVNKLISNTIWGQRSNYLSIPTDCPQRNERLGWTADTQVFAETGSFFADTRAFFHKWMRDMRDSQSSYGGYPSVAPKAQYGAFDNNMMRFGWADAGIIVPWTIWKQFGDTLIIDENWESMDLFMRHVHTSRYDHNVLSAENGNNQWGDWLSFEALESWGKGAFTPKKADGTRDPLPEAINYWNYLSACYWAMDADMMRDMAGASGRDAAAYAAMAAEARTYIQGNFFNADGSFKAAILNTMQTPSLFALRVGKLGSAVREAAIMRLRENFAAHEGCLQTGFLGTSILMETLSENGMADIAYDLLFQHRNPSWLYSVDNGATTIWERWNSYTIESGMAPKGMNSFNHYAYGCVCQWLWERAAGISADPAEPGFKHILLRPLPDKRLGSIDAVFRSPAGIIKSAWHFEGDTCIWEFTIPEGSSAAVTLPDNTVKEYGSGSYSLEL